MGAPGALTTLNDATRQAMKAAAIPLVPGARRIETNGTQGQSVPLRYFGFAADAEYAGNVVPAGRPIVLVTDAGREAEARVRLARIGFDTCLPAQLNQPAPAIQAQHCEGPRLASKQRLTIRSTHPLNGETPITALIGDMVTSNADFYVRNHFHIPLLDPGTWRLQVVGLVDRPLYLTLRDLYTMSSHTLAVTLECAGNGRSGIGHPIEGVPWALGAVGTAEWTGVPLVDVLHRAGIQPTAREVMFRGADSGAEGRAGRTHYERSLTIDDATAPHVLLAYAMNGEPLPVQHGYPVRLIVPGWYGMAAVKWLTDVTVTDRAFAGPYQTGSYHYEWGRGGQLVLEPITLQRVRSLITEPLAGEQIDAGQLIIRGVAWSGAAPIARVEVSVGDRPWQAAQLLDTRSRYHWQRWKLITKVNRGETTIKARAADLAGCIQPETADGNRWGYGNNAIQQVAIGIV